MATPAVVTLSFEQGPVGSYLRYDEANLEVQRYSSDNAPYVPSATSDKEFQIVSTNQIAGAESQQGITAQGNGLDIFGAPGSSYQNAKLDLISIQVGPSPIGRSPFYDGRDTYGASALSGDLNSVTATGPSDVLDYPGGGVSGDFVTYSFNNLTNADFIELSGGLFAAGVFDNVQIALHDSGATSGSATADAMTGTSAMDHVRLLGGNDTYAGGASFDEIYGNQGDDLLFGNRGEDTLAGGQGNDSVYGGRDNDLISGDLGNDLLSGDVGDDTLAGGQGSDVLYGGQGNDVLFGGADADTLHGGQGSDTLYGGQGNDVLYGDLGNDVLSGDLGADRYVFGANSGTDLILGFKQSEGDRIDLQGQSYMLGTATDGNALLTLSGGGTVELSGVQASAVNTSFFG